MTMPPVPPIASRRRGERTSQSRAAPAASAQMPSQTSAIVQKTAPSVSSCSATDPAAGSTNCGSTATKKTMTFGFATPTTNASASIRRSCARLRPARPAPRPARGGGGTLCTPR